MNLTLGFSSFKKPLLLSFFFFPILLFISCQTLAPNPEVSTFNVIYEANGADSGNVPTDNKDYLEDEIAIVLPNTGNLAKVGRHFSGWTNVSGLVYAGGADLIMGSNDMTLYANWTFSPNYAVTYKANGGSGAPIGSSTYERGDEVTISSLNPTPPERHTFKNWNTANDGSGITYASGSTFYMGFSDVTLFAIYEKTAFTVTYDANGGSNPPRDASIYTNGQSVRVSSRKPTQPGGQFFKAWNTANDGSGITYASGSTFNMGPSDVTLFAIFEDTFTWTSSSSGVTITKYNGNALDVVVPSTINGQTVTKIGQYAFQNKALTSISLPDGLTVIENAAFWDCRSLTSVTLPNSLINIENHAFFGCSSLPSISLPNSLTSIGDRTFSGCSSLVSISLPDSLTSIGDYAFNLCVSLRLIDLPGSLTSIGSHAFNGCRSLSSIDLPGSLTSIGSHAFNDCRSLSSIDLPDNLTSIGSHTFYACSSLTSIGLPNNATTIGDYAFAYCISLNSIDLPNGITSIEDDAFRDCSELATVTVQATTPPGLGSSAFSGLPTDFKIYVPATSVAAYKVTSGWVDFDSSIYAISN